MPLECAAPAAALLEIEIVRRVGLILAARRGSMIMMFEDVSDRKMCPI
jgi:hypothetical protein